ncbi:MAG: helix-turn-helix domain containing protein [Pseudolabrys sp.]
MTKQNAIIAAAERAFDRNGFSATSMDVLARAAKVSSRTLYKHIGSRAELIDKVLELREKHFFDVCRPDDIGALFAALDQWYWSTGANGCLFLRAASENRSLPSVAKAMKRHKKKFHELVARLVADEIGPNEVVAEQILVLFEGANAAAVYRGALAIEAAAAAAQAVLAAARTATA